MLQGSPRRRIRGGQSRSGKALPRFRWGLPGHEEGPTPSEGCRALSIQERGAERYSWISPGRAGPAAATTASAPVMNRSNSETTAERSGAAFASCAVKSAYAAV